MDQDTKVSNHKSLVGSATKSKIGTYEESSKVPEECWEESSSKDSLDKSESKKGVGDVEVTRSGESWNLLSSRGSHSNSESKGDCDELGEMLSSMSKGKETSLGILKLYPVFGAKPSKERELRPLATPTAAEEVLRTP